jgi:hypothetical protein
MIEWLEWQAFGLALFSTCLYGRSKLWGALVGLAACASFMWLGLLADIQAAIWMQAGFGFFSARNLHIAIQETRASRARPRQWGW